MQRLASILNNNLFPAHVNKGLQSSVIVNLATKILKQLFGEEINDYAEVKFFKNGALNILCDSSTTAQQIKLNEANLIASINSKLGRPAINKINIYSLK